MRIAPRIFSSDGLVSRLKAARRLDSFQLETIVRFPGGDVHRLHGLVREENEHLPAEQVDHAYGSLVLPDSANVLGLELELPTSL